MAAGSAGSGSDPTPPASGDETDRAEVLAAHNSPLHSLTDPQIKTFIR